MTSTSHKKASAFTPLRVALMIFITISIISATIAYVFNQQPWAHLLGIISTVFIIMVVFLQILELVWLNSMRIHQKDPVVKKTYQHAMMVYLVLLPLGIILSVLVLL